MLPTHNVPCPHCGRTLYWAQSLEDGVNEATPSSPALGHDAQGDFVLCPHCRGRVAMRRIDLPASSEIQIDREATRRQGHTVSPAADRLRSRRTRSSPPGACPR